MNRPDWVPDAVFYQIFPDRFRNGDKSLDRPDTQLWGSPPDRTHFQGGDLAGITEGLAYLEDLGVTAVYLNPIFAAATNHRYDTSDYFAIDPRLGDAGSFKELLDEAHGRGIRVVLDAVFNHCGDTHPAFGDWVASGNEGDHARWFLEWEGAAEDAPTYQTCGGTPYLPKLNTAEPGVRDHLIACALHWLDLGIDGWRLDVPWKIETDFWDRFMKAVSHHHPDAYVVAEAWRDATPMLNRFDGAMNYQQRAAIIDYCLNDDMDGEDFAITVEELVARHGSAAPWMLNLVGSHDTARIRTVADGSADRTKLALTAMFALPGVPTVYYGDEVGLEGGDDPGCRGAMPWDRHQWDDDMLEHVRRLIAARRSSEALRRGSFQRVLERNGLCVIRRVSSTDEAIVVVNPRDRVGAFSVAATNGEWTDAIGGGRYIATDGQLSIPSVGRASGMILRRSET